jgi:NAD(P)-dependent dehydrogenase (short-subunit alcohol dehydrogenase family)
VPTRPTFTQELAVELGPNVQVNGVAPAVVKTLASVYPLSPSRCLLLPALMRSLGAAPMAMGKCKHDNSGRTPRR